MKTNRILLPLAALSVLALSGCDPEEATTLTKNATLNFKLPVTITAPPTDQVAPTKAPAFYAFEKTINVSLTDLWSTVGSVDIVGVYAASAELLASATSALEGGPYDVQNFVIHSSKVQGDLTIPTYRLGQTYTSDALKIYYNKLVQAFIDAGPTGLIDLKVSGETNVPPGTALEFANKVASVFKVKII